MFIPELNWILSTELIKIIKSEQWLGFRIVILLLFRKIIQLANGIHLGFYFGCG